MGTHRQVHRQVSQFQSVSRHRVIGVGVGVELFAVAAASSTRAAAQQQQQQQQRQQQPALGVLLCSSSSSGSSSSSSSSKSKQPLSYHLLTLFCCARARQGGWGRTGGGSLVRYGNHGRAEHARAPRAATRTVAPRELTATVSPLFCFVFIRVPLHPPLPRATALLRRRLRRFVASPRRAAPRAGRLLRHPLPPPPTHPLRASARASSPSPARPNYFNPSPFCPTPCHNAQLLDEGT